MKIKIQNKLQNALKSKNLNEANVYRNILSKIIEKEKEKGNSISNNDIEVVIEKYIKQREESKEIAIKYNRNDLLEKEQFEINLLQEFISVKKTESEIRQIIKELIDNGNKDIKSIMSGLSIYGNTIDKKTASILIKELLG